MVKKRVVLTLILAFFMLLGTITLKAEEVANKPDFSFLKSARLSGFYSWTYAQFYGGGILTIADWKDGILQLGIGGYISDYRRKVVLDLSSNSRMLIEGLGWDYKLPLDLNIGGFFPVGDIIQLIKGEIGFDKVDWGFSFTVVKFKFDLTDVLKVFGL